MPTVRIVFMLGLGLCVVGLGGALGLFDVAASERPQTAAWHAMIPLQAIPLEHLRLALIAAFAVMGLALLTRSVRERRSREGALSPAAYMPAPAALDPEEIRDDVAGVGGVSRDRALLGTAGAAGRGALSADRVEDIRQLNRFFDAHRSALLTLWRAGPAVDGDLKAWRATVNDLMNRDRFVSLVMTRAELISMVTGEIQAQDAADQSYRMRFVVEQARARGIGTGRTTAPRSPAVPMNAGATTRAPAPVPAPAPAPRPLPIRRRRLRLGSSQGQHPNHMTERFAGAQPHNFFD